MPNVRCIQLGYALASKFLQVFLGCFLNLCTSSGQLGCNYVTQNVYPVHPAIKNKLNTLFIWCCSSLVFKVFAFKRKQSLPNYCNENSTDDNKNNNDIKQQPEEANENLEMQCKHEARDTESKKFQLRMTKRKIHCFD